MGVEASRTRIAVVGAPPQGAPPTAAQQEVEEVRRPDTACEARDSRRPCYRQLKPHPGSAGNSVAEHQIARIHAATIDLVAEGGHEFLTVTAITRTAGVSKRTFYAHFADKDDCFLETYDLIVRTMVRGALATQGKDPDRMERLRSAFAACAREVTDCPRAAHLALIDIYLDLPGAKERVGHTAGLLEALIERSFSPAPDGAELPRQLYRAIVGACTALARARLLAGAGQKFGEEARELAAWALSLRDPAAKEAFSTPPRPGPPSPAPGGDPAAPVGEGPGSEREAIVALAAEMAAIEGYAAVSAERIGRKLALPKARVRPQLPSREECLIAALEDHGRRAIAEVRAAFSTQRDWADAVSAGIASLCARLDADTVLRRIALAEVFESGQAATVWRSSRLQGLAALVRATAPPESRPTLLQAEASLAGIWAILATAHQGAPSKELRALAPGLTYIILAPVIGAPRAAAALRWPSGGAAAAADRSAPATEAARRSSGLDGPMHEREPVPGC